MFDLIRTRNEKTGEVHLAASFGDYGDIEGGVTYCGQEMERIDLTTYWEHVDSTERVTCKRCITRACRSRNDRYVQYLAGCVQVIANDMTMRPGAYTHADTMTLNAMIAYCNEIEADNKGQPL